MMSFIEQAFTELSPEKDLPVIKVKYTDKFKPYNANVRHNFFNNVIEFRLSKKWREVSDDIRIGLVQSLLVKIYKSKDRTLNMDLYNSFTRNLHISIPKNLTDPVLEQSFDRVNEKYFFSTLEKPNFVWGSDSKRTLGSYEYRSDVVKISSLFRNAPEHLLDYVMYHELLHKKHKFYTKSGRSYHHTSKFKKSEREFENQSQIEKELSKLCRRARTKRFFFLNW